jgi:hypothetical protein
MIPDSVKRSNMGLSTYLLQFYERFAKALQPVGDKGYLPQLNLKMGW